MKSLRLCLGGILFGFVTSHGFAAETYILPDTHSVQDVFGS